MSIGRSCAAALTLFNASATSAKATAQQPSTVAATPAPASDDPCTTGSVVDLAAMAPFLDRILIPGKPFSLTGISPKKMAKMGATMNAAAKQQANGRTMGEAGDGEKV